MNAVDSEIRSRYLALALDARRMMDVLIPFVESGQRNELLEKAVHEAIDALTSASDTTRVGAVHSNLAFDEYEQALTIDEVRGEEGRKSVIQDLQQISAQDRETQREAAMRALEFFFAVESRALQHYDRRPALVSQ